MALCEGNPTTNQYCRKRLHTRTSYCNKLYALWELQVDTGSLTSMSTQVSPWIGTQTPQTKLNQIKKISQWHIYANTLTITYFPNIITEGKAGDSFPGISFIHFVWANHDTLNLPKAYLTLTCKVPRFFNWYRRSFGNIVFHGRKHIRIISSQS